MLLVLLIWTFIVNLALFCRTEIVEFQEHGLGKSGAGFGTDQRHQRATVGKQEFRLGGDNERAENECKGCYAVSNYLIERPSSDN